MLLQTELIKTAFKLNLKNGYLQFTPSSRLFKTPEWRLWNNGVVAVDPRTEIKLF